MTRSFILYLQISREGDVDLLSIRGDPVQKQRVVHGTVPSCVESVESSTVSKKNMFQEGNGSLKACKYLSNIQIILENNTIVPMIDSQRDTAIKKNKQQMKNSLPAAVIGSDSANKTEQRT